MDPTTGALIVAALSVLATPFTAWLSFRWGRGQERERRESERLAEAERWEREERKRRVLRGEEAAGRLLEVVDNAATLFTGTKLEQSDTRAAYTEVLRLAELLTDDAVRDKMGKVARGMYFYHSAFDMNGNLAYGNVATAFSSAAHDVLRAYLHERPIPETPRLDRLLVLIAEGDDIRYGHLGSDDLAELDPLGGHEEDDYPAGEPGYKDDSSAR